VCEGGVGGVARFEKRGSEQEGEGAIGSEDPARAVTAKSGG
jgi:hypothetical protein